MAEAAAAATVCIDFVFGLRLVLMVTPASASEPVES